jgi:hypothetical protein
LAGDHRDPARRLHQHVEGGTARAGVEGDVVVRAVAAEEHRGDVTDDPRAGELVVVGPVEIAAGVDMARHVGIG